MAVTITDPGIYALRKAFFLSSGRQFPYAPVKEM